LLTAEDKLHFETFGFLFKRQAFSPEEIGKITDDASIMFEEDREGRPFGEGQGVSRFVESPRMSWLAEDDRIYGTVEGLLGPGFVWAGSEGNVTVKALHRWHADRPGDTQLAFQRVKVMIYLDKVTGDSGSLRVIPGSHRAPFHSDLRFLNDLQSDADARPFGVEPQELPGVALESSPGDVVFFNQCLYHAVFNGWVGRRYLALKFAHRPASPEDVEALMEYSPYVFDPAEFFLKSDRPRIRGLVEGLAEMAPKG
jgi:hypothetical protein